MKHLDMTGAVCPIPVIEAGKILQEKSVDIVMILVDNEVAVNNLSRLANSIEAEISIDKKSDRECMVTIKKSDNSNDKLSDMPLPTGAEKRSDFDRFDKAKTKDMAIVIGSNSLGRGSEELGKILMKGFIYSLIRLELPPAHIIFMNSGVFLTTEDSDTAHDLKKLEEKGTTILSCGSCMDYYKITDKLAVGFIADMYEITNITVNAKNSIFY